MSRPGETVNKKFKDSTKLTEKNNIIETMDILETFSQNVWMTSHLIILLKNKEQMKQEQLYKMTT